MSPSTPSPFVNVESSPPGVNSVLHSRFKTVAIQPGAVSGDHHSPAISVAFGGESVDRETLLLPDMKGHGEIGRELGKHLVDQSGKSLSVPVIIDSFVSGGGISAHSSSVWPLKEMGIDVESSVFDSLALFSRLRTRSNLLAPGRYDNFLKTIPLGIKPTILVRLFLVLVGSLGTTLCGGRIWEYNLQACISSTLPSSSGCAIHRHINK